MPDWLIRGYTQAQAPITRLATKGFEGKKSPLFWRRFWSFTPGFFVLGPGSSFTALRFLCEVWMHSSRRMQNISSLKTERTWTCNESWLGSCGKGCFANICSLPQIKCSLTDCKFLLIHQRLRHCLQIYGIHSSNCQYWYFPLIKRIMNPNKSNNKLIERKLQLPPHKMTVSLPSRSLMQNQVILTLTVIGKVSRIKGKHRRQNGAWTKKTHISLNIQQIIELCQPLEKEQRQFNAYFLPQRTHCAGKLQFLATSCLQSSQPS